MPKCLIALGSNLGNRQHHLDEAVKQLLAHENIRFLARSRPITTNPVGGPTGQDRFLNEVVMIETDRTPESLLECAQQVEHLLGRVRNQRWGARTIDIDLLMVDQMIVHNSLLQLPHPRMIYRRFVLQPATEVAPQLEHPLLGWSLSRLLDNLNSPVNYLAFTGSDANRTQQFAHTVAEQLDLNLLTDAQNATLHQAGQTLARWLEFLDHRHELVASQTGKTREQFTVADFWTNEVLAACRMDLSAPELQIFQQRWNELKPKITQPKLLIYLTTPNSDRHAEQQNSLPNTDRVMTREARFSAELDKIVSKPAPCPVLRMHADNPRTIEELAAVIECLNSNTHPAN